MILPEEKKPIVVFDLTSWPEDWGKDEATIAYLHPSKWQYEPPTCYYCGHQGNYQDYSPLALREVVHPNGSKDPDLVHFDCWGLRKVFPPK